MTDFEKSVRATKKMKMLAKTKGWKHSGNPEISSWDRDFGRGKKQVQAHVTIWNFDDGLSDLEVEASRYITTKKGLVKTILTAPFISGRKTLFKARLIPTEKAIKQTGIILRNPDKVKTMIKAKGLLDKVI